MSAVISPCGTYRYSLSREIDMLGDTSFAYFGINPSTADHIIDDSTVKKWIGFARLNSAKNFIVGNVFAYRSTDVKNLAYVDDPIGPDNNRHIDLIIDKVDVLVPCWGSRHKLPKTLHNHLDLLMVKLKGSGKPVKTFGFTKSGDPIHPLMLSYETKLRLI